MKRQFSATEWREGNWYVSQCLEVDIASQGETEEAALANLKEALELHFEAPQATRPPKIVSRVGMIADAARRSACATSLAKIQLV